APMQMEDGRQEARNRGTPQGGVVSPVLANLFLHYTIDAWMRREMRSVRLCRYADDGVVHCRSEVQAQLVLRKLKARLRACGLELAAQMRQGAERPREHVQPRSSGLGELLRSVPSISAKATVVARERLLGSMAAAQVQASRTTWSHPRLAGAWTAC